MERLYSPREASQYLGVHIQTCYRWLREGKITAVKPTKRTVRIQESELSRFAGISNRRRLNRMIIDSRTVSVSEAAQLMGVSEGQVIELTKHSFLQAAKEQGGHTRIALHSLESYSRRNGISLRHGALQKPTKRHDTFTVKEAMTRLSITDEKVLHKNYIQTGKLKAYFSGGEYVIDGDSLREYVMGGASI